MSEVSNVRGGINPLVTPASAKGVAADKALKGQNESGQNTLGTGNELPLVREITLPANDQLNAVDTDRSNNEASPQDLQLDDALESMNSTVQSVQRDLLFTVDDASERTIVKVLDTASGEVIRQIPEQTFLELAQKMKEYAEQGKLGSLAELRLIDDAS